MNPTVYKTLFSYLVQTALSLVNAETHVRIFKADTKTDYIAHVNVEHFPFQSNKNCSRFQSHST